MTPLLPACRSLKNVKKPLISQKNTILQIHHHLLGFQVPVKPTKGVVAAQTATIHAGYLASSNATLVEFATAEETIAAVRNGEADAVLADSGYLKPIVDESNGELAFVGNQIQIGGGVGMGVRKSDGALRAKLNTAIASVKSDGTLNKMIAKWFGADAPQF